MAFHAKCVAIGSLCALFDRAESELKTLLLQFCFIIALRAVAMAHSDESYRATDNREQITWVPGEYEAGYQARRQGITEFTTATPCWRAGWQEANREINLSGEAPEQSSRGNTDQEQWSLFGRGASARSCELPFDEARGEIWKRSWIQADIALGLRNRLRCR